MREHGFARTEPFIRARYRGADREASTDRRGPGADALVQAQVEQYVQVGAPVPPEAAVAARNITEPGLARGHDGVSPDMTTEPRQGFETIDVAERLRSRRRSSPTRSRSTSSRAGSSPK